jgi:hypothetical protein
VDGRLSVGSWEKRFCDAASDGRVALKVARKLIAHIKYFRT